MVAGGNSIHGRVDHLSYSTEVRGGSFLDKDSPIGGLDWFGGRLVAFAASKVLHG